MYSSYRCASKQNQRSCNCKEIRKELIESYVLDELNHILFDDNTIEQLEQMLNAHIKQRQVQDKKELTKYNKELENIDNEISNILKLVSNGSLAFDTIKNSINELEERKSYIENQVKSITDVDTSSYITNEKIKELISRSKEFLLTKNISECRKFISSYVDKVVVFNDKIEVYYKISAYDNDTKEVVNLFSSTPLTELHNRYKGKIAKVV